ncbi:alpha/beta fold hydrolase [Lysobacter antibioticus]|uniref:alpha/beta fold hydrolase n=1 Tax=Lysobacter antibioticus TaxID=84531 RepID=UPI0004D03B1F|nr:alpha/beta hydrolase [Lysobacter antibioticus]
MTSIPTREHWINTDPGRLYAKAWMPATDAGESVPIILFHDSLGCVELWRDFPVRLARTTGRQVVAYDRLGFGRSDRHPGHLDGRFVHDEAHGAFTALRNQLKIGRFVAFGHSVGGGMAIGCAASFLEDCTGLITESAQAFVEDRTLQGIRAAQQSFAEPGQLERLQKYHGDKAAWVLSAWIDTWLAPSFAGWNLDEALGRIRCPNLVIHGEHDEFGSLLHPQRIADLTHGPAINRILKGCGHVPHREAPETVLELIDSWLDASDDRMVS